METQKNCIPLYDSLLRLTLKKVRLYHILTYIKEKNINLKKKSFFLNCFISANV